MKKRILDKDRYTFLEKSVMEVYSAEENEKRNLEIEAFLKEMKIYLSTPEKLSEENLSQEKRDLSLNLAHILASEDKLWEKTEKERAIPLGIFSRMVEEPAFELKKMKGHILAYALLVRANHYPFMRKHLQVGEKNNEDDAKADPSVHTGLALKDKGRYVFILTTDGRFMKIRNEGHAPGGIATGKRAPKRVNLALPLIILLTAALLSLGVYQYLSKRVERTILLFAAGEIRMDFNALGNLVDITGVNEAGRNLVLQSTFDDRDIDTVLAELIEQAYITESIKERSEITILVSGAFLPEDFFRSGETRDRILSYQLDAKINNNGSLLPVE